MFRPIAQNRWFIYTIVFALVAALFVWWQVEQFGVEQDIVSATDQIVIANKKPPLENNSDTSGLPSDEVLRGWKTYRNEKYGFEFRYPSDWPQPGVLDSDSGSGSMILFRRDMEYILLDLIILSDADFPENKKCKEKPVYAENSKYICTTGQTFSLGEDNSIIGVEYKYFSKFRPVDGERVLIVKEHKLLITPSPFTLNDNSLANQELKQILSTLKFFEPTVQ
jgi:hypothetical protein